MAAQTKIIMARSMPLCQSPRQTHAVPQTTRVSPHVFTTPPKVSKPRARTLIITDAHPRHAVHAMVDPVQQARVDALMQKFMDADHDGNGVIDKQELRTLLESVGGDAPKEHWLTDSELDSIHQLYDKDHNGTISFDEFVHIAEDGVLLEGKLHEYQAVFQAMDTDGDEFLSATEVHAMMKQLGVPNVDMTRVREILNEYDVDKSGKIDFYEFLRMFRSQLLDLHDILEFLGMPAPSTARPAKGMVSLKGLFVEAPPCKPGTITNVFSEAELDSVLHRHARDNKLIVVMAGMTFCSACKAFVPSYLNLAKDFKDVVFLKFYGNSNEDTKQLYKKRFGSNRALPAFQFYRNMQVVDTVYGAKYSRVEEALHSHAPRAWQHGMMSALGL